MTGTLKPGVLRRLLPGLIAFLAGLGPSSASGNPAAPLALTWVYPAEGTIAPVSSSPTVYDNVVYVGDDAGRLHALHATGPRAGTLLPGYPIVLEGAIKGRPAVYGARGVERLYVATTAGLLYAFRLDGSPAWPVNPQPISPGVPIISTPAVRGPYVFITTSDGRLVRRLAADGRPAGGMMYGRTVQTRLARDLPALPARTHLEVEDAAVLFPAGRIRVISDRLPGDPKSTSFTYSAVNTAVRPHRLLNLAPVGRGSAITTIPKGSLVVGQGPGIACNLSPAVPGPDDATMLITALNGGAPARPFTPADRNLVAARSEPFGLLPQWETTLSGEITSAPLVNDQRGLLYVASRAEVGTGFLHSLHASNGLPDARWNGGKPLPLQGVLESGPWLDSSRDRLYFGTSAGILYAVSARDGSAASTPVALPQAGGFLATPVVAGNHLFLGSTTGRFYSVPLNRPGDVRVYVAPDGKPFTASPAATGGGPGENVVVIGSQVGRIFAFPVE